MTHLASFLGEQYILGGQTKASLYMTFCGDKLTEPEVRPVGQLTCMTCIAQDDRR